MELEVVRVVLMEPGEYHRMQEVLKMMWQGMKLEILGNEEYREYG